VEINLYGHRRGGETNVTYFIQHCTRGGTLKDGGIDIKTIAQIPLKAIGFTVAQLCGIEALHFLMKAQMQTIVVCFQGTIFNWSEVVVSNMKGQLTKFKMGKIKKIACGAFVISFSMGKIPLLATQVSVERGGGELPTIRFIPDFFD